MGFFGGSGGTTITEAAGYSNFAAGSDGDIGLDTTTNTYYKYNETLGLWMPPDVQPTETIFEFDGSDVPQGADGWSASGTADQASDGSIYTITDDADPNSYRLWQRANGALLNTNNIGLVARIQIASENTTVTGYKAMLSLKPSGEKAGCLCIAGGSDGVGGAAQIFPFQSSAGGSLTGVPTYSADNSAYQIYYIFWGKTTKKYEMGVLGDPGCSYKMDTAAFTTNYITNSSAGFGTYSTTAQCTMNVDYFKTFTF